MGRRPAGMHHPLRDPFMIEVRDLLAQMEVLHQRRPAITGLQRVIGVGQAHALGRGEELPRLRANLFG